MRRLTIYLFDIVGIAVALYLAAAIRFEGEVPHDELILLLLAVPFVAGGKLFALYLFQCDRWSFKYAGTIELRKLLAALSLGSLISWALIYFLGPDGISRAVLLLEPLFSLFILGAFRFGMRIFPPEIGRGMGEEKVDGRPVLIVGAGEAGVMTLREIRRHPDSQLLVRGFIDDAPEKAGQWINGVRVLGGREEIKSASAALNIEEVIIAIPTAEGDVIRDIIASCRELQVRFRVVPGLMSIIQGDVNFENIRELRPEDLLGRETTELDHSVFESDFKGRRILVTGAGGSIGSEISRQLAAAGAHVILLDHSETALYMILHELRDRFGKDCPVDGRIGDIRCRERIANILSEVRPEIVFHAAACKHVSLMEQNPSEAVTTNIFGTVNLIEESEAVGVGRFVFISTDKAVRPSGIMGASKRIAELCVLSRTSTMPIATVRFGNVFGSSGSVIPLFRRQIQAGGPVTVTHPYVVRFFMTIEEAVYLVLQASLAAEGKELFVLEMGQPIRILDLARNMITLSGLRPDVDIKVELTGLQPGEKLVEEVLTDRENVRPTKYEKIYRVERPLLLPEKFPDRLKSLREHTGVSDQDLMEELMDLARAAEDE